MANPSGKWNHQDQTKKRYHLYNFSLRWSRDEQTILEEGLLKFAAEDFLTRNIQIAKMLPDKSVRDVALRVSWMKGKYPGMTMMYNDDSISYKELKIQERESKASEKESHASECGNQRQAESNEGNHPFHISHENKGSEQHMTLVLDQAKKMKIEFDIFKKAAQGT